MKGRRERIVCLECCRDNEVDVVDGKIVYCYDVCVHVWLKMLEDSGMDIDDMKLNVEFADEV